MEGQLRNVHVTILAGGSGTRLWPLSRHTLPKQLLRLGGQESLLQRTVNRVLPLVPIEHIYILTGPDHADAIAAQLPDLPRENLFIEPTPKGTAPCLGLAALKLRQRHGSRAVMLALHADHVIADEAAFRQALRAAVGAAERGFLVTVGIVPTHAETGFGYIQRSEALQGAGSLAVYRVSRFTEKPPLAEAERYVESGEYYWNAGYFAWTLSNIMEEFQRLLPETYARLDAIVPEVNAEQTFEIWEQIAPATIDVGIMEQARKVAVVPASMGWNDVGSWAALYDVSDKDARGCVITGAAEHVGIDTRNTLIHSDGKLVATVGLRDMIVVETEDALLILPMERAQEVGDLVRELRRRGLNRHL
jgi:mannose-1-phosphate guanylyltransferase